MGRALECPACGAKHPVASLPPTPTFRCERCGQTLRVPTGVATGSPMPTRKPTTTPAPAPVPAPTSAASPTPTVTEAAPPAAAVPTAIPISTASASTGGPPPPPRRRAPGGPITPIAVPPASVTATLPAGDGVDGRAVPPGSPRGTPSTGAGAPLRRVRWYWRLVAWVAAVPLGFLVAGYPSYHYGLITKGDILDIFVGEGIGRYGRLAAVTAAWAFATALLVQLFVDGGRWYIERRRTRRVGSAPPPRARPGAPRHAPRPASAPRGRLQRPGREDGRPVGS